MTPTPDDKSRQRGVLGPWAYTRDENGWKWTNVGFPDLSYEEKTWDGARTLVVGYDRAGSEGGSLLVIELEHALTLAKAWEALRQDDFAKVMEQLPEPYRSQVADVVDEKSVDGEEIDRDWLFDWAIEGGLEWPAQDMLTLLPEPIIERFGELSFSGTSGPCLIIAHRHRADIIRALQDAGYQVIEDDALTAAGDAAEV